MLQPHQTRIEGARSPIETSSKCIMMMCRIAIKCRTPSLLRVDNSILRPSRVFHSRHFRDLVMKWGQAIQRIKETKSHYHHRISFKEEFQTFHPGIRCLSALQPLKSTKCFQPPTILMQSSKKNKTKTQPPKYQSQEKAAAWFKPRMKRIIIKTNIKWTYQASRLSISRWLSHPNIIKTSHTQGPQAPSVTVNAEMP